MPRLNPDFKRTGHRISLLGVARYCAEGPKLSEKHGAGRAALMSQVFHAKQAAEPRWREGWARLDETMKTELSAWKAPTTIVTLEGDDRVELDYQSSDKELLLGLTENGRYADPNKQDVMLRGYMDFGWVRQARGTKVAYVCDIKKSEWTTSDGPDDPQVAAYGFGYADMHGCDAFVPAIWAATEGTWEWGSWIDLESSRAADLWATVRAAAQNRSGGFVTGQHCRGCYARLHCSEHVLPATVADTRLAGLDTGDLTPETALQALLFVQSAEDVIKKAKETLQEAVRRGLEIRDPNTGKVYRATTCKGRESVSMDKLRQELGDKASAFINRGSEYTMFRWQKA